MVGEGERRKTCRHPLVHQAQAKSLVLLRSGIILG